MEDWIALELSIVLFKSCTIFYFARKRWKIQSEHNYYAEYNFLSFKAWWKAYTKEKKENFIRAFRNLLSK